MKTESLRVIVVDDERLARRSLRRQLDAEPNVTIVGEASCVDEAEALIRDTQPEIVFLDIQLRGETGFDLLRRDAGSYQTVFVTAFDKYAVRAFEVHALDYLLKPVDPERLSEVLARAQRPSVDASVATAPAYGNDDLYFHNDMRSPRFIRIREIAFIRAAGNYTELHSITGPPLLELRTLSTWETQLSGTSFVRVHRSLLINLDFIERIERGTNHSYEIYIKGHATPLPMSRRRATELKSRHEALRLR